MNALDMYYRLRPFIPRHVQVGLREIRARHRLGAYTQSWPIDEAAGEPPPGWRGWPGGKAFALVMTHDVESAHGISQCRALMDLHERFGTRASFNIVPERYPVPPELREEITARGFEVGVHGLNHDGKLFRSLKLFNSRASRINTYLRDWQASGFRAPSMHSNLQWMHALDIDYDLSTFDTDPFEPCPQGVGTIFPFRVVAEDGGRSFMELPYTLVQDFTLFILLGEKSTGIWQRKLDWIAKKGGMALLIVHPDYIDFNGDGDGWRTYSSRRLEEFFAYVTGHYAGAFWNALPRDVARHCAYMPATPPARLPGGHRQTAPDKRVCVLRHGNYPQDPRVFKEVRALTDAGYTVDVICLKRDQQPPREQIDGVNIVRLPWGCDRKSAIRYAVLYGFSFLCMMGLLAWRSLRSPYACVQVNTMPDFLVFATWPARWRGSRILLDMHEPCPELFQTKYGTRRLQWLFRFQVAMERWAIRYADSVITVNETIRDRFVERGAPREKIRIVRNVPDERIEAPVPDGAGHAGFLMVTHGTIQPRYGHEIILRALPLLRERIPGIHLRIIGKGETIPVLHALAAELGCADAVTFTGAVAYAQIPALLREADVGLVTLLPSPFAPLCQPNKLFEYAALRIPAVCARFAAIEEVFDDSCVAFFKAGDAADLAARILELHANPGKRQDLASHAFERYQQLSWPETRHHYVRCVDDLVKHPPAAHHPAAQPKEGLHYAS